MISVEGFMEAFPQFGIETYPDARVQFWLNFAQKMLNKKRWGNIFEEGVYLYTAHNLTVESNAVKSGGGGSAGAGAVTSESQTIGETSYSQSYDAMSYAGAGQMASTIYGQQYLDLVKIVGAGGVQL